MKKDTDTDFGQLVGNLLLYFNNIKELPYTIRLYKDVPISHIRIGNPLRSYIKTESNYQAYFQHCGIDKIKELLSILEIALNDNSIFTVEEEYQLLHSDIISSLPEDDIVILKEIIHICRIFVFIDDLNQDKKFAHPITAMMESDNSISIHPGRKRIGILEYLFLKTHDEYYVDVILYKSKKADPSPNHDSFLIDKEFTVIKSMDQFSLAYGYPSIAEFLLDIKNMNVSLCYNDMNTCYINKHTSFPKEKFINKFPKIIRMCQ